MPEFYDARDTQDPAAREAALLARLPALVANAVAAPGWARHLGAMDPGAFRTRAGRGAGPGGTLVMNRARIVALPAGGDRD
jgi:hypothetical protein